MSMEELDEYLFRWMEERGYILEEHGIDAYIAVTSFVNYVKENYHDSN
jgi:hypothetical protein